MHAIGGSVVSPAPGAKPMARQHETSPVYSGEKARGGKIILRTRRERAIFIAGLVGAAILALLLAWFAW